MTLSKHLFALSTSLALIALSGCSKKGHKAAPTPPLPVVTVTTVVQKDVPLYRDYVGFIEPHATVKIQPQVSGELKNAFFTQGESLVQGQLLFEIDKKPYIALVKQAEADLQQARTQLELAQEKATRYGALFSEGYVSALDYEQITSSVKQLSALVEKSAASLESARIDLEHCSISSPINGVSGELKIDVGNLVSPNDPNGLITINQIDPIYATFHAPQADLPLLSTGQVTQCFLGPNDKNPIEGSLTLIDNEVDLDTGTILLRATFKNGCRKLWPGLYTPVKLIIKTEKNALLVPRDAVQIGATGAYIYTLDDENKVHLVQVTMKQAHDQNVVIEGKVNSGDRVIHIGGSNLSPGKKVSVKS